MPLLNSEPQAVPPQPTVLSEVFTPSRHFYHQVIPHRCGLSHNLQLTLERRSPHLVLLLRNVSPLVFLGGSPAMLLKNAITFFKSFFHLLVPPVCSPQPANPCQCSSAVSPPLSTRLSWLTLEQAPPILIECNSSFPFEVHEPHDEVPVNK